LLPLHHLEGIKEREKLATSGQKAAPRWNRTNNPVIKSHLLCQLS
jgi:hypothetical protein